MNAYATSVFINVPFDLRYKKLFDALVFAVHDCGCVVRCANEEGDSSQIRLEKLYKIIGECRFGIHDLSRTTLDSSKRLPRFNMPLERVAEAQHPGLEGCSFVDAGFRPVLGEPCET